MLKTSIAAWPFAIAVMFFVGVIGLGLSSGSPETDIPQAAEESRLNTQEETINGPEVGLDVTKDKTDAPENRLDVPEDKMNVQEDMMNDPEDKMNEPEDDLNEPNEGFPRVIVQEKALQEPPEAIQPIKAPMVALDPKIQKELPEKKKTQRGWFETTMEATQTDGKIDIAFSTKNRSGRDLSIMFGSGQKYDFRVYDDQGHEIYRWSNDKGFTQAVIEMELLAEEQLTFHETWDLVDNTGNPVPKGQYTIAVEVLLGVPFVMIDRSELTAKALVEVK